MDEVTNLDQDLSQFAQRATYQKVRALNGTISGLGLDASGHDKVDRLFFEEFREVTQIVGVTFDGWDQIR